MKINLKKLKHRLFILPYINKIPNVKRFGFSEAHFKKDIKYNGLEIFFKDLFIAIPILMLSELIFMHNLFYDLGLVVGTLVYVCITGLLCIPTFLLCILYKRCNSYFVLRKFERKKSYVDSISEYLEIVGENEANTVWNIFYYLNIENVINDINNLIHMLYTYNKDNPYFLYIQVEKNKLEKSLYDDRLDKHSEIILYTLYKHKIKLDILNEVNEKVITNKIELTEEILDMNSEMITELYNDFKSINDLEKSNEHLKMYEMTKTEKIKSKELIELFNTIK